LGVMINAADIPLGLHADGGCISNDMHIAVGSRLAADTVHWQVDPVPWFFAYFHFI